MRVLLLLGLLALCASAFAVQDDAALQPNFATEGDDDSFLEALSANMNINEDLDNEINALDDVKSADELKDKATEIADKLAEMKAELDEEEARVHKHRKNDDAAKKEQPKGNAPPKPEQEQKRKADFNDKCQWTKVENHFVKAFSPKDKSKGRVVVVNAEGKFVRAFAGDNKDKATKWAQEHKDVNTPPAGWTQNGHAWFKTVGDATLVRFGYGCFSARKFDKKEDAEAFGKKINDGFAAWIADKDHCTTCPKVESDKEQQQQKEQQQTPPQSQAPGQTPPQSQAPGQTPPQAPGAQTPPQAPADNKPDTTKKNGAFDDAMNDEEDQPQQQQQQQQAPQQQQQQQAPQQQQQAPKPKQQQQQDKSAEPKQQQQQDKSNQKTQKKDDKVQKKDDKKVQKKDDKKDQKKDDKKVQKKDDKKEQKKEQQQDKATVEARVAKLKKHGFEEVEIGKQTFLFGVVHYTTGAGKQKVKTVVTNDKGNYVREFNKEREAEWLQKKLEKKTAHLTFPPKGYEVSEARKFLTRAVEKKTYIRGNFYPFSLVHCKNNDKLEECVAAKKQQLQEKADKLEKEEEHKDVETPEEEVNNEAQTDETVEAEAVPAVTPKQENDEADDI